MIWLGRRLSVPLLAMVAAGWLGLEGWLEADWMVAAYSVPTMLALYLWRRAALRLEPALSTAQADLGPALAKELKILSWVTIIGSLALIYITVLLLAFWPGTWSQSALVMVGAVIAVISYAKLGVFAVLARWLFEHRGRSVPGQPS